MLRTLTNTADRIRHRHGSFGEGQSDGIELAKEHLNNDSLYGGLQIVLGNWWWIVRDGSLTAWRWLRRLLRNRLSDFMGFNSDLSLYSTASHVDHNSEDSALDIAARNGTTSVVDDPGRGASQASTTPCRITCGLFEPHS